MHQDYDLKIGGAAGQGLQVIGDLIAKALARSGLHLFAYQDFYSRVRGGHNFYHVRAASSPVFSHKSRLDILVALDQASITRHYDEIGAGGVLLFDSQNVQVEANSPNVMGLDLAKLAVEGGGHKIMANTVAAGAVWHIVGGESELLAGAIADTFASKGEKIVASNQAAAAAGARWAQEMFRGNCSMKVNRQSTDSRMVLTGNEALALGALAAGCRFVSAYPMTPASGIVEHMNGKADRMSLAFEQAEDEISAINMAMGAAFCGVRSMVATSGGGFSLMVEGLSLAGCTETPVVIAMGQRPGPSTGMATRTEQGDLLFCLHAGHGEFPRAILTPGHPEDAFWAMIHAFNLADRYHIPVFVMTDQLLADGYATLTPPDVQRVTIDRGPLAPVDSLASDEPYRRYQFTANGVSPRAFPGQSEKLVISTGNEHDETGLSTEDPTLRTRMVQKRLAKSRPLADEVLPPVGYGGEDAATVLLTWGSSYGACREAVDLLHEDDQDVSMIHLPQVWPFPARALLPLLASTSRVVTVEMNATGQLGRLLRQETLIQPHAAILKYDGRPMNGEFVVEELAKGGQNPW